VWDKEWWKAAVVEFEVTGRNHEDVCQYSVSCYKYSQERYRLSHRARYNVGINDPCMVKEFSNLGRHLYLCRWQVTAVCHGRTARARGGVAATAWCRVLLETTAESGLVDN